MSQKNKSFIDEAHLVKMAGMELLALFFCEFKDLGLGLG